MTRTILEQLQVVSVVVRATVVKTVQMRVDTRTPDWETQLAEVVGKHAGHLFPDCEVEDVVAEVLEEDE